MKNTITKEARKIICPGCKGITYRDLSYLINTNFCHCSKCLRELKVTQMTGIKEFYIGVRKEQ